MPALSRTALGIDEATILKRLEQSPTHFLLSDAQVDELKKLKASEKLIAAMQKGQAQPSAAGAADAGPNDVADFAIVLDCSGSMQEKTKDGPTKMEAAKQAVNVVVQQIPNGQRLAFIIYGHDKALKCDAVKVVREMSVLDGAGKAELLRAVDALSPVGVTPIALALRLLFFR